MKAAVITFPGSNCDRDLVVAFRGAGFDVSRVWHKETELPLDVDVVGIPGGFSFGDYLRCGAIAARSPVAGAIRSHAARGGYVLGICNGFQVLTETGLLPGALMRNAGLKFVCKVVGLRVDAATAFTASYGLGAKIRLPVAHHDGNYTADPETMARLEGEGRIAFRYTDSPNGSMGDVAGIVSDNGRVFGLMPHPERAVDAELGSTDGAGVFRSLMGGMALA